MSKGDIFRTRRGFLRASGALGLAGLSRIAPGDRTAAARDISAR